MLGRMTTTMRFLSVSGAPLGSTLIGHLAGRVGLTSMVVALGALALAAAAWSWRRLADPVSK